MHARELVELAAIVSHHGPVLLRETESVSKTSIEEYWVASKSRLDRWGRMLKAISSGSASASRDLPPVRGIVEEILTGEVLTRVWTALMCVYDRDQGSGEMEPVARSVMLGHLEARHRVLTLLVRGPGIDADEAVKFNRLRRRVERWNDMLIGYLAAEYDVAEFAIDPDRAVEFAADLQQQKQQPGGQMAWPLIQASLRAAFADDLLSVSPNADLNCRIAESILACFPANMFDGTGLVRSLWLSRMTTAADDAQGMVEDLVATWDSPVSHYATQPVAPTRYATRRRFDG